MKAFAITSLVAILEAVGNKNTSKKIKENPTEPLEIKGKVYVEVGLNDHAGNLLLNLFNSKYLASLQPRNPGKKLNYMPTNSGRKLVICSWIFTPRFTPPCNAAFTRRFMGKRKYFVGVISLARDVHNILFSADTVLS